MDGFCDWERRLIVKGVGFDIDPARRALGLRLGFTEAEIEHLRNSTRLRQRRNSFSLPAALAELRSRLNAPEET